MEEHFPAEAALHEDVTTAGGLLPTGAPPMLHLLELTIKTTSPSELVEVFMSVLHERMAQGDLCRERTIKMLYVDLVWGEGGRKEGREGGREVSENSIPRLHAESGVCLALCCCFSCCCHMPAQGYRSVFVSVGREDEKRRN